jgi:hypothetical protein
VQDHRPIGFHLARVPHFSRAPFAREVGTSLSPQPLNVPENPEASIWKEKLEKFPKMGTDMLVWSGHSCPLPLTNTTRVKEQRPSAEQEEPRTDQPEPKLPREVPSWRVHFGREGGDFDFPSTIPLAASHNNREGTTSVGP